MRRKYEKTKSEEARGGMRKEKMRRTETIKYN